MKIWYLSWKSILRILQEHMQSHINNMAEVMIHRSTTKYREMSLDQIQLLQIMEAHSVFLRTSLGWQAKSWWADGIFHLRWSVWAQYEQSQWSWHVSIYACELDFQSIIAVSDVLLPFKILGTLGAPREGYCVSGV